MLSKGSAATLNAAAQKIISSFSLIGKAFKVLVVALISNRIYKSTFYGNYSDPSGIREENRFFFSFCLICSILRKLGHDNSPSLPFPAPLIPACSFKRV